MRLKSYGRLVPKKMIFFKWLCLLLITAAGFVIMTTGESVKPLLTVPLALAVSIREEELPTALHAALCGLLLDMSMGRPFGFNAFILIIFAVGGSLLFRLLLRQNILNLIMLTALTTVIQGLLDFLFFHSLWNFGGERSIFFGYYLPQMIYTLIASIPAYIVVIFIEDIFGAKDDTAIEEKNENIVRE